MASFQEEIVLLKKDTENNARLDTQSADFKDQYKALVLENKMLEKQVAAKFNAEKFGSEQEL